MMIEEEQIVAFLRCPASGLVDYAVSLANLNWKEATAIDLCGRKALTQERAAEIAGYSVDAVQRWYRSGITKLMQAWAGIWWIEKILE